MAKAGEDYERLAQSVYDMLNRNQPSGTVEVLHDQTLTGISGATHQLDVLWRFRDTAGKLITVVVEAKDWGSAVKKEKIAALKGVLVDLAEPTMGFFVTKTGYQSGAKLYAAHWNIQLHLLKDLAPEEFAHVASRAQTVVYRGTRPVLLGLRVDFNAERRAETKEKLGDGAPKQISFDASWGLEFRPEDADPQTLGEILEAKTDVRQPCEVTTLRHEFDGPVRITTKERLVPEVWLDAVEFDYKIVPWEQVEVGVRADEVEKILKDAAGRGQVVTVSDADGKPVRAPR